MVNEDEDDDRRGHSTTKNDAVIIVEEGQEEATYAQTGGNARGSTVPPAPAVSKFNQPQLLLPLTGVCKEVVEYLMEVNRPVSSSAVSQRLRAEYTKLQIDKGIALAVEKGYVNSTEEGAKMYWISQPYLIDFLERTASSASNAEAEGSSAEAERRLEKVAEVASRRKETLEGEVRRLIAEPGNDQLVSQLASVRREIADLTSRLSEIERISAKAAAAGKTPQQYGAEMTGQIKKQLEFYRKEWKERKRLAEEFLQNVADSKNLKGTSARHELFVDKIGVELDPAPPPSTTDSLTPGKRTK